jgi:uncharacterized membrane protein YphA (DoxX/SURF4 family)
VLGLEGARLCSLHAALGPSRLGAIFHLGGLGASALGVVLFACTGALLLGLFARIGAVISLVVAGLAAYSAYTSFKGVDAPREIADIVAACSVALVSLYILIHGAGVWSMDAALAAPER